MVRGQNDMSRSGKKSNSGGSDSGNAHTYRTDCICICKIGSKMTCAGLERGPALVGQILEMLIFLELTVFVFVR